MYQKDFLENLYREMLRIRICEESFIEPILKKEIKTPVHLYSGQEAIATGVCATLKEKDVIFGSHRSHGHYLAKGGDMNKLVAEVYGKETGCCRGRGGSMHLIFPEKGFLGSTPIVGGTISLAMGAALAFKIKSAFAKASADKENRIAVSFFGDGATGEGVLYESLNFAALKKLPLIFVCENNFYSTHLPVKETRPDLPIYKIAEPFGIKTWQIDGNDVLKVYQTAKEAVELCRKNKGPVFIECLTYRQRGHVGPDDNIQGEHTEIRPKKEVEKWKKKDPIKRFEKYLLVKRITSKEELKKIKEEVEKEVAEAFKFAKESPYPNPKKLKKYVFK